MRLKDFLIGSILATSAASSFALSVNTFTTARFLPVAGSDTRYEIDGFGRATTSVLRQGAKLAIAPLALGPGQEYFYDKWNLDTSLMTPGDYSFSNWVIPVTGTLSFTSFVMHSYKDGDLLDVLFDVGDGSSATGSGMFTVENNGTSRPCGVKVCVWFEIHGVQTVGASAGYGPTLPLLAVPEPETYALMLAGLAAVGALARRHRLRTG